MAKKVKDNRRFSLNNFFDSDMSVSKGEIFEAFDGSIFDSRKVHVLHHGIDTIKQLYKGLIRSDVYQAIESVYSGSPNAEYSLDNCTWKVSSGYRGGYRFLLNNKELGVVVLLGSKYCLPQYNGDHLKIELSPEFILQRTADQIQDKLNRIAALFIKQVVPTNVAIHICADVQGWVPPDDLDRRLTCRAHRVFKITGESFIEFDDLGISKVFGRGETFLFGKPSGLQFCVYDKLKACKAKGNLDFWESIWKSDKDFLNSSYDPDKQVTRFELRFHHSVVSQFARGSSLDLRQFRAVSEHLTGLWRYGLDTYRLDDSKVYINPFWQYLRDDLVFLHDLQAIDYKRCYKSQVDDSAPSDRSIMICFGQLVAIYGKSKYSLSKAIHCLMSSGIWFHLCSIYTGRGLDQDDIFIDLEDKLSLYA